MWINKIWFTSIVGMSGHKCFQCYVAHYLQFRMYGDNKWRSFYPLVPHNCDGESGRPGNQAGGCPGSSRYPHWPSSPPLVAFDDGNTAIAYTWISNTHLKPHSLDAYDYDPSTALYRVTYKYGSDKGSLPKAELVNPTFWSKNDYSYGLAGGVVRKNVAYLWGQDSHGKMALARVSARSIENSAGYEFFVGGTWTKKKPVVGDRAASIENVSAGGQGTYYWSEHWQSYVWIGQSSPSIHAYFYITTAPKPAGPWAKPSYFYSGENGNGIFPAYSTQAHPGFSDPGKNEIYVTYTKCDDRPYDGYSTPLIRIEWESISPKGSTGCSGKYQNENGWCWRYCNGTSGRWCYTRKDCLSKEYVCDTMSKCTGLSCDIADEGCVKDCP